MRHVPRLVISVLLASLIVLAGFRLMDVGLREGDPRLTTGDTGIVMLTADWCGYCLRLRRDFDRAGVPYQRLDIDTEHGAQAMRALGAVSVPVTVIGQSVVPRYNPELLQRRLTPLGYYVYAHPPDADD